MQEYEEWMKEKAPRRTSDECHTPTDVYEVIADWVSEEYHIPRESMCRPFFPGGDFESFDYSKKIVVDNPPFSILSKIVKFYTKNNVKFFLFAPSLTAFSSSVYMDVCHIFAGHGISYDNGVKVATYFITNLDESTLARSCQYLRGKIQECPSQPKKRRKEKTQLGSDEFHGAKLNKLSSNGLDFTFKRSDCMYIRKTREGKKFMAEASD